MQTRLIFLIFTAFLSLRAAAQATTGSVSGNITGDKGVLLHGASVKIIYEPTGTTYFSTTGKTGNFSIPNLAPGNAYLIEVSFINYEPQQKKEIAINLGEETIIDFVLKQQASTLQQVTVYATASNHTNKETLI